MQYTIFSVPPSLAGKTIGDVALGDDGRMYAVTLDNSGTACWTCIEDSNLPSIIISLLRTIKWSTSMYHDKSAVQNPDASDKCVKSVTKRKKTAYNRHIGNVLTELSRTHPDMPRRERMRIAVNSWKDVKMNKMLTPPSQQDSAFTQRTTPTGDPPILGDCVIPSEAIEETSVDQKCVDQTSPDPT